VSILAAPLNWVIHDLFTDSSLDRSPALHCTTFGRPQLVLAPDWWRQRQQPLVVDREPLSPLARRVAAVSSAGSALRRERDAQLGKPIGARGGGAARGAGSGDAPGPGKGRAGKPASNVKSTLLLFFLAKWVASCVAATLLLPRGVFLPVFALGAVLGRLAAQYLTDWGAVTTVVGGGYAVVGAAAMVAASTCSISVAVIAFEMTGQISNMMPVLLAVLVASHVGRIVSVSAYQDLASVSRLKKDPMLQPVALFNRVVRDALRPLVGGDAKRARAAAAKGNAAEEADKAATLTATRVPARLFALEAGDAGDDDTQPLAAKDGDRGDISALHRAPAAALKAAAARARRYSAVGDTAFKPDDDSQPATVVSVFYVPLHITRIVLTI
jgi:hypothetical protein